MGTSISNPSSNPNPILDQNQFIDPATGHLTYAAWNLLYTMRQSAQIAVSGTVATVTPAPQGADNSTQINGAIMAIMAVGGGALQLVAGIYNLLGPIVFPAGRNGILILGNWATLQRGANMPVNQGLIDIQGAQGVTVQHLTIDGAVTVSAKINYSTFAGDPMYPAFLLNTSVWVHAGSTDIQFDGVTIQHTGGYAFLSDTRVGPDNERLKLTRCNFWNNRPFLFGVNNADLNYGSWLGGVFYKADCSSSVNTGVTNDFVVSDCSFERNTGNCVWGHASGFFNFHRNIRIVNNGFLDCGLDAIEVGVSVGGCVIGNVGQRIGYICTDDTSQSYPRYLPGFNATFLDVTGYAEGIPFLGNSCTSVCGGFAALDGYAYASVTGNSFRQPQPGEVLYVDDQIALVPSGVVYGYSMNNSMSNNGGDGVDLSGNTIYGCTAGSILAIAFRHGKIAANDIWQPGDSTFQPILLGNLGASNLERTYNTSITGNRIAWSPATPKPAIAEVLNWGAGNQPWIASDQNWVEGNHVYDPAKNAFEFSKDASSGSIASRRISSITPNLTADGHLDLRRFTAANGTAGYLSLFNAQQAEPFRIYDADDAAGLTSGAVLAMRSLRFRQKNTDDPQARSIQSASTFLGVYGAGTTATNRAIHLLDLVTIGGAAGSVALSILLGNVAFGSNFNWDNTANILAIAGTLNVTGVINLGGIPVPTLNATPPAGHASAGTVGMLAIDGSGNFYFCYATNSWAQIGPLGYSNTF